MSDNSVDIVIDCVGGKPTRQLASQVIRPGGVIIHVGLMDNTDGLDIRKITLQEVTVKGSYTYTMLDFQATVNAMHQGLLGELDWFETSPLSEGDKAFKDLLAGKVSAAKVLLLPDM